MAYVTYQDLIDHALSYLGGDPGTANSDKARRAVLRAYEELPTRHSWTFFKGIGRVTTYPQYSTGTIAYDQTGGVNERQVTLTGGTWPAWAAGAVLVLSSVPYDVESRVSDTVITLTSGTNPGADVAAGATYSLYQDSYDLPADFLVAYQASLDTITSTLLYKRPDEWAAYRRRNVGPGKPLMWTFTGNGQPSGAMKARFWPAPDAQYVVDFLYRRRARRLVLDRKEDGLVATAGTTTVTGTNTLFTASMVGSVIRVGSTGGDALTGWDGANPPAEERVIDAVASATSLTVTTAFSNTVSGARYVVSDPADIEPDIHLRYLYREIERQARLAARMKSVSAEDAEYVRAMAEAKAADSRYDGPRAAGAEWLPRYRLRDYPHGTEFQ